MLQINVRIILRVRQEKTVSLSEDEYQDLEYRGDSPEETVVKKNTTERIQILCNKLKEPYRTVAINYFCKDVKLSHLAKETGQNIKTLETQLYRSKKMLKDLWKEEFM
ncbi:RNA polymerase sigma factor (sigma-70 family) [Clostridium beijerinckii]|nr:RNA polymerase sigma factor (sigma-70 family) [Clostridium beijerinckii]